MLPHVSHRRFLPIHFHNNILLVAFRLDFDIPLFGNRDQHCLIIDFAANTTSLVNSPGGINRFLAKPFVESLEVLPY